MTLSEPSQQLRLQEHEDENYENYTRYVLEILEPWFQKQIQLGKLKEGKTFSVIMTQNLCTQLVKIMLVLFLVTKTFMMKNDYGKE